jgi:hypothetical protein
MVAESFRRNLFLTRVPKGTEIFLMRRLASLTYFVSLKKVMFRSKHLVLGGGARVHRQPGHLVIEIQEAHGFSHANDAHQQG